jgi:hypothetical protein
MKKIKTRDIVEIIAMILVYSLCAGLGYLGGGLIADDNADIVTKVHLEEYQDGYTYCPYCGEELKKEVEE